VGVVDGVPRLNFTRERKRKEEAQKIQEEKLKRNCQKGEFPFSLFIKICAKVKMHPSTCNYGWSP
jgi:hypothetical protein